MIWVSTDLKTGVEAQRLIKLSDGTTSKRPDVYKESHTIEFRRKKER